MAIGREVVLNCQDCGESAAFEIYPAINVTLQPELKACVLDGALFLFRCARCRAAYPVLYSTLYHDMKRGIMIWLYTDEGSPMEENELKAMQQVLPGKKRTLRIVRNYFELREKICIFDTGLEDTIMEGLKLFLLSSKQESRADTIKYYFQGKVDELNKAHLLFDTVSDDKTGGIAVPMELYEMMQHGSGKTLRLTPEEQAGWCEVNLDYAIQRLRLKSHR